NSHQSLDYRTNDFPSRYFSRHNPRSQTPDPKPRIPANLPITITPCPHADTSSRPPPLLLPQLRRSHWKHNAPPAPSPIPLHRSPPPSPLSPTAATKPSPSRSPNASSASSAPAPSSTRTS